MQTCDDRSHFKNSFNFNLQTHNPTLVAEEIQYLVKNLPTQEIEIFT
jgi:hypothetical protein